MSLRENMAGSIWGETAAGAYGIGRIMDRMEAYGIRGVFFVDPMPALVFGVQVVAEIVAPVLARGHEVQLHLHTEWLQWVRDSPVHGRTGRNIGDFSLADQIALIGTARELLIAAGAPPPCAFRAGNFGANDDTLRALAQTGIRWDASYNAAYVGRGCEIGVAAGAVDPVHVCGTHELPTAGLWERPGQFRPAQICALSAEEMRRALHHAAATQAPVFAAVTHSFEMLSRDRRRPNRMVLQRLEAACRIIAEHPGLSSGGFADLAPPAETTSERSHLPPERLRRARRLAEQAVGMLLYERTLRPR